MAWANLDDGFCNHPKVVALIFHPTADGVRALAYWTMALSWAYRHTLTKASDEQGVIPESQLRAWGKLMDREHEAAEALADVGLWDRLPDGHYRIHDFRHWGHLDERDAKVRGGRMTANKRWGTELPLEASSSASSYPDSIATSTPRTPATDELIAPTSTSTTTTTTTTKSKPSVSAPAEFDTFWSTYPRRIGKQAARNSWTRAVKTTDPQVILQGAAAYAEQRENQDPKFTAHPATWLNQGRWDDEPDEPSGGPRFVTPQW